MTAYPYLALLALTLAVELTLVAGVARRWGARGLVADAALLNLASHPAAFLLLHSAVASFWSLEVAVVAAEAAGFAALSRLRLPRALGLAVLTNGATIALARLL